MRHFLTYRMQVRNRVRYLEDRTPFQPYLPPNGPERVFAVVVGLTEKQFKLLCATLKTSFEERHAVISWWTEDELRERDEPLLLNFRRQWKALCEAEESSSERAKPNRDLKFLKQFRDTLAEVLEYDAPEDLTTRAGSPFLDEMTAKLKSGKFSLLEFERDRNKRPEWDDSPEVSRGPLEPHEIEGSALYWLHGWGVRLQALREKDAPPSKDDWTTFRPDEHARNAIDQLSIKYPIIIRGIVAYLETANRCFDAFLKRVTEKTEFALTQAEGELTRRVNSAVEIIIANEKRDDPKVIGSVTGAISKANSRPSGISTTDEGALGSHSRSGMTKWTKVTANVRAMELSKKDPLFVMRSQRQWANEIGCSTGLVAKTDLWKATMRKREMVAVPKGVRAKSVSPSALDALSKLVDEQNVDSRNDDRMERVSKRVRSDDA